MTNSEKFHIPSLDGMRAIAVLMVFLSHSGFHHLVPGGLGVTVFFFLSGYLITTLLRMEYENTNKINLKSFYLRRVYRLFPPLYIVIFISWITVVSGIFPHKLTLIGTGSQLLQFTNYHIIFEGKNGLLPGLGILWSLAVEEHFYLIFPLLYLTLRRKVNTRTSLTVFAAVCTGILIWRFIFVFTWGLPEGYPDAGVYAYTYYASEARIDSLLMGCIMAVGFNPALARVQISQLKRNSLIITGFMAILFSLLYRDPEFRETWRYTLQGIALMPIFYFAIRDPNLPIFKPLNFAPLVYIGKISYTFYLSHYLFIYLAIELAGSSLLTKNILGFSITFLFSAAMYHFIEKYFAKLRRALHK